MSSQSHPEWEKENSLTAPADRDRVNKWKPDQSLPPLTNTETVSAMAELNITAFVDKFPRVDKTYADSVVTMQNYGLVSFTPAKGATPDKDGVYGFAKLRGNFQTEMEASQRAEFIIRNDDSYHRIYHAYVGRPFPMTSSTKYSAETDEIDIRKKIATETSQSVKDQKAEERRTVQEIQQREEALLEESKNEDDDPYENYITLRVKKAQLSWTYLEHQKKIEEIKGIIIRTREEIEVNDSENPEFKDKYFEKFMKARKSAGIKESSADSVDNFIKYMVDDAFLPGIDDVESTTTGGENV